ncbi:MAG TPA: hypothetical protein VMT72_10345 [Pseudolabrys sp.]|nr:hypothetical protein [Pseudolabrys sp.]
MTPDQLIELKSNPKFRAHLVKFVALHCFRNTKLENLHAGKSPSSRTGDYSDVKVVTPYGEIPWTEVSRFNDDEMKELMIDVVNQTDRYLGAILVTKKGEEVVETLKMYDPVPNWNDPDWYDRITLEEVDQLDELIKKLKAKVR